MIEEDEYGAFVPYMPWRYVRGGGWSVEGYGGRYPRVSWYRISSVHIRRHHFDPEPAEHTAFVRGSMPPYVYADVLEEWGVPLPPEVYRLLRSGVPT